MAPAVLGVVTRRAARHSQSVFRRRDLKALQRRSRIRGLDSDPGARTAYEESRSLALEGWLKTEHRQFRLGRRALFERTPEASTYASAV